MNDWQFRDCLKGIQGLSARVKAELYMLFKAARDVALKVLRFLLSHRHLNAALLLGALVAFLLMQIPWIGGFLALLALVTIAAVGLMCQIRNELEREFA